MLFYPISMVRHSDLDVLIFDHAGTDYDGPGDTSAGWDYLDNKSFCYQM